jgi:hypothetical protein
VKRLLLSLLLAFPASAQDLETLQINVTVQPALGTYSTTFDGSENPLSEGGAWVNNNPGGVGSFNRNEKYNGTVFQTFSHGEYDGVSHLTGFQPDQWIEGELWVSPTFNSPNDPAEGTLSVRMTTRATGTQADPLIEMYGMAYKMWGTTPPYGSSLIIGLWDGNSAQRSDPNTFYGRLTNQLTGHADCNSGLRSGDRFRFTVQGQSPPRLNVYMQRNDGSPEWVRCTAADVVDNGASSIITLPTYGPSWHTPFLTGDPGVTTFENNVAVKRTSGFTAVSAGQCPAWPASCAP